MAEALARTRSFTVLWLALATAGLGGAAWLVSRPAAGIVVPDGGIPAAPALAAGEAQARKIIISSPEGTYTVVRTPRGWVLSERGDYPVSPDKPAALQQTLANLRFERPMTRDPAKLERLSLGDPAMGGKGVVVQVEDERAAPLVDLVFGFEDRGVYARERNSSQAWAVAGDLAPLGSPALWLTGPVSLRGEAFARFDIAPSDGPGYALLSGEGGYVLGRPYSWRRIVAPERASGVAQALQQLAPLDVQPAPAIGGAPQARLLAFTADGLRVDVELHREEGAFWAKVTAAAPTGEPPEDLQRRVQDINAEFAPWAFRLSPEAVGALQPSLSALTGIDASALAPPRPAAPAPVSAEPAKSE